MGKDCDFFDGDEVDAYTCDQFYEEKDTLENLASACTPQNNNIFQKYSSDYETNNKLSGEISYNDNIAKVCYINNVFLNLPNKYKRNFSYDEIGGGVYGNIGIIINKKTNKILAIEKHIVENPEEEYPEGEKDLPEYGTNIHECLIGLELVNKCREILPNYIYTYGISTYENLDGIENYNPNNKNLPIVISEYINSVTLKEYTNPILKYGDNDYAFSYEKAAKFYGNIHKILLQIFNALNILKIMNGVYTHYDLHGDNILIRELDNYVYIPIFYTSEDGYIKKVEYLKTNKIAYIIDYGANTYFSYETLFRKFQNNSTEYYGMNINEIYKKFIFGQNLPSHNYKEEFQAFDIYKLLSHIFRKIVKVCVLNYTVTNNPTFKLNIKSRKNLSIKNNVYLKEEDVNDDDFVIEKLSEILGTLFNFFNNKEENPYLDFYKLNDAMAKSANRYHSLNTENTTTYMQMVDFLSKKVVEKDYDILSEEKILSNKNFLKIPSATCLNKDCAVNFENFIKNIWEGKESKIDKFYPVDIIKINDDILKRREITNSMINYLSKNKPKL